MSSDRFAPTAAGRRRLGDLRAMFWVDVLAERRRQDREWGGHEHDVTHDTFDWNDYRMKQERLAASAGNRYERYERLVKLTALCLAEIEARVLFSDEGDGDD